MLAALLLVVPMFCPVRAGDEAELLIETIEVRELLLGAAVSRCAHRVPPHFHKPQP